MKNPPLPFFVGQRWLSETEPELGLGIVVACDLRTVTVEFRSCAETRRYAQQQAPLKRMVFKEGEKVRDREEQVFVVQAVQSDGDLVAYQVQAVDAPSDAAVVPLAESELSDHLVLNRPFDRLLLGQIDSLQWFALKKMTLEQLAVIGQAEVLGLCSGRTELIPHQLYIAAEVARRYAPRVMLADEVGLGKTIEAGMILQQQLLSGLASRVLIIVPEPLLHQWLVEMLRRFNLRFSLYDKERCEALAEEHGDNPFLDEQLVLTSMGLLSANAHLFEQVCAGEWDLCIVDEAHHLQDDSAAGMDSDYARMSVLAHNCNGMLLLTATPEQLGDESHFALLRLLDPDRFDDYQKFTEQQTHYRALAGTLDELLQDRAKNQQQIQQLLDEHGTGRILFRNTRRSLSGFPGRELQAWPLSPATDSIDMQSDEWPSVEPRVLWLREFLQQNRKDKILLICADDEVAIALEKYLRVQLGVRSSVFHRHMNIVERDRAAAYFANTESGARIMVCSEIGSEGRNFQFCRHLVLFDLPLNPDLLEQRIGRLDRIGQQHTVQIHVPYIKGSSQELLFQWYEQGLNAFVNVAPAAWRVYREFAQTLHNFLVEGDSSLALDTNWRQAYEAFLRQVAARAQELTLELEKGRDRLLEINSFRAEEAQKVIAEIQAFEASSTPEQLLTAIFDSYGIHHEHNSDDTWTVYPGEEMLLPSFPELPEEGIEGCFQRKTALHREDVQFLTWMHPLVRGAMELVLDTHLGRAVVSRIKSGRHALTEHEVVLEALYRVVIPAPAKLQLQRYFPDTSLHCVVAATDDDPLLLDLDDSTIAASVDYMDKHQGQLCVSEHLNTIQMLLQHSEKLAQLAMTKSVNMAASKMLERQTTEIRRLVSLKQRNPNVRDSELNFLREQTLQLHECFKRASVEMVALHIMIKG